MKLSDSEYNSQSQLHTDRSDVGSGELMAMPRPESKPPEEQQGKCLASRTRAELREQMGLAQSAEGEPRTTMGKRGTCSAGSGENWAGSLLNCYSAAEGEHQPEHPKGQRPGDPHSTMKQRQCFS